VQDIRTDELLLRSAGAAHYLGLKLGWSDSLEGDGLKACSGVGAAAWKNAKALNENLAAAAGEFTTRARKRNPLLPAGANNLLLVEVDLEVPDDAYPPLDEVKQRVGAVMRRLGLSVPRTVIVRSRRGLHFYFRPPAGRPPAKVQITEGGELTWSSDGYVVGVPGLHELKGVVYEYVADDAIAELEL
jgi:hypothetical protein